MAKLNTKQKNIELAKEGKQLLFYALKLRIYPTDEQEILINKTFGCSRMIYNQYLNDRIEHFANTGKTYSVYDYKKNVLNPQKKTDDYKFLKEVDKFALEFALESVQDAYNRFFSKQCKFPNFKSKRNDIQSYTTKVTNDNIRLNLNNTIQIPKLKSVSFAMPKSSKNNNKLAKLQNGIARITKATISKEGNRYYISLTLEEVVPLINKLELSEIDYSKVIGIDLGLKDFAIINNGTSTYKIDNPKYYKKYEKKLKKLSKRLSKKVEGSKNYEKAKAKLNKHHSKIKNSRNDFLHQLSRQICNENQVVVLETLNIKGMIKNKHLSKSISDAGWSKFIGYLKYKLEWEGKHLIQIDRFYASSKICSACGNKNIMLTLNDREWVCSHCHTKHDRDENASINIRQEGIKLLEEKLKIA